MILETERLYLRELTQEDYKSLCKILQDKETMYAYEGAFSDTEVQEWIDRQIFRYKEWNFGLWAVVLKETDEMIGQCGLTMHHGRIRKCWKLAIFFNSYIGIKVMLQKLQKRVRNMLLRY